MRIALLGVSHWHASMHLDAARAAGAEIACVWDEDAAEAARFSGGAYRNVVRFEDALDSGVDLAVLMGHPATVPARARAVIEAGVPTVLEKPAVTNTAELVPLVELAGARNAFVAVPLPNRFGPVFPAWRHLQEEGRAGAVGHASFRIVNGPPQRYRDDRVAWLLAPQIGGGGALRNLGIHGIDAALSLAQGRLQVVSASLGPVLYREAVEDYALVVLRDSAGTLFTVEAGYTYASMAPGGDFEWRLSAQNASLIDRGDTASCATLDDGTLRQLTPEPPSIRYRLFMADTLKRLAAGQAPAVGIEDYLAAMVLIDTAYLEARR